MDVPAAGALLHRTRRGVRLAGGTTPLPWIGSGLEDFAAVIDLPSPARTFRFELEPGHSLALEAGFAWGSSFSAAIAIPPGPLANVTLPTPVSHLRLRGKGFLAALIVEPAADVQVTQVLPSILLADTPRIAPPQSATAASLQQPSAPGVIAPRRPLGMKLRWDPAAMIGGWSIPGLAPPIEAAGFAIERRIEASGAWAPVMDTDSPVFGGRSYGDDSTAAILPGVNLMATFPEEPQPDAATPDFAIEDLFLTNEDGAGEAAPPPPGTLLRYRLASIDWAGRRGAGVTETAPARLEKHEPPPVPAGADPRTADQLDDPGPTGVLATVLVQGGDMGPDERLLLGDSDNAIVLEWGWQANEREIDPFATHFRVYLSSPLEAVPCEIQRHRTSGGPSRRVHRHGAAGPCDRGRGRQGPVRNRSLPLLRGRPYGRARHQSHPGDPAPRAERRLQRTGPGPHIPAPNHVARLTRPMPGRAGCPGGPDHRRAALRFIVQRHRAT